MTQNSFSERLARAVTQRRTPVLVGLDPRIDMLPKSLQPTGTAIPAEEAAAYEQFCTEVIDVVAPLVAAVKPQAAFFEALGPEGTDTLSKVIRYATDAGLIVVLDAKRGDIGSTAEAYAAAYLGRESAWGADALTVNPYLGDDTLMPFVEACDRCNAGIFVLVKTSNPGSGHLQDVVVDGLPIYGRVAQTVEQLSSDRVSDSGYGSIGAVVGATHPEQLPELRAAMRHCWLLVPGFGAQGGTAADVAGAFDQRGLGAIVNNSRGIIFAYRQKPYAEKFGDANWQQAVEQATRDMIAQLRADTPAGQL
jgi:orotidine-5'-phosphate decarboxylase